jgi:hypothetical protein
MLIAADDIATDELPGDDGWAPIAQLVDVEPGPAMIAYLNALDPTEIREDDAVTVMELWHRQAAWLAERMTSAVAKVAGPTPSKEAAKTDVIGDDWNIDYVGAALGLSSGSARVRVEGARRLTESLPRCRAAMAAGDLTLQHLWAIVEAIADLDADAIALVDERVASKIRGQSWSAFRRTLRRAVLAAAPDLAEALHGSAADDRRVELSYYENDGMAEIRAVMTAVDAHTVWLGLNSAADAARLADQAAGLDRRGIDACRADALCEWAMAQLARPEAPTKHGRPVEIQVVIDLPSLLGLAENPAELNGFGPIPASIARELAVDAKWRRLVVEPVTGHLLDFGSVVYRPPQELADYIVARDRRCRFPGCNRKGAYCDIDHNDPAPHGPTSSHNCCCLCRRHHRLKTFGGWQVEMREDFTCVWTSPSGRRFYVPPLAQLE